MKTYWQDRKARRAFNTIHSKLLEIRGNRNHHQNLEFSILMLSLYLFLGQKHREWLRRLCQNYRPKLIDACVESLVYTGLSESATLTCEKPEWNHLWETTGQPPVRQNITSRKWTLIGHTLRRPNYCIVRQALRWNQQGGRRRGRPCNSWRRNADHTIQSRGLSWHQLVGTERTLSVACVPRCNHDQTSDKRNQMTKKDISANQKCWILCSTFLLHVFDLPVLLPWQPTGFQTFSILKAFLGVPFWYLLMAHNMHDLASI